MVFEFSLVGEITEFGVVVCPIHAEYHTALNTPVPLHQGRGRDRNNLGDLKCDLRPICMR